MEFKALDAYTLKARYYPTSIVVVPLCLLVLSLAAGQLDLWRSLGVALVSGLGLAFVMDQIGRDGGRKRQPLLFESWGGPPTTLILRHSHGSIDKHTKARYHRTLSELLPDLELPNEDEETQNPGQADAVYASCTEFLKENTRDHERFPLVFQENSNYGFRRNLWGMKAGGVAIAAIGTVACAAVCIHRFSGPPASWLLPATSTLISAVLLSLWIFRFTPSWIKMTAFAYARQLVAACDSLAKQQEK